MLLLKGISSKNKEMFATARDKGELGNELKESEYMKSGLQAFRQKNYVEAAVYWEVVLIINAQNNQARQGLNRARTAMIQSKEEEEQTKQSNINTHLQQGLDAYGSGDILNSLKAWIKILEIDLENKDALDYIVVAKADLTEDDYRSLRSHIDIKDVKQMPDVAVTDTIRLDQSKIQSAADHQSTDKTKLPDGEAVSLSEIDDDPYSIDLEEEEEAITFGGDDDMLEEEEEEAALEPMVDELAVDDDMVDFMEDEPLSPEEDDLDDLDMGEPEMVDELEDDSSLDDEMQDDEFLDDDMLDDELQDEVEAEKIDDIMDLDEALPDDDFEMLDDELDEDFELDDEFVDEEEVEETLAAEYDAAMTDDADADSVQSLVDKYFERGLALYKLRNYEEAIIEWKKIFDIDKNNDQAKEYIEKAITLYEASPFIEEHLSTGKQLLEEGKHEDAIKEFEKILEIDPELDDALAGIDQAKMKLAETVVPARSRTVSLGDEMEPIELTARKFDFMQPKVLITAAAAFIALIGFGIYSFVLQPRAEKNQQIEQQQSQVNARKKIKSKIAMHIGDAEMDMKLKHYTDAIANWSMALALDENNDKIKSGLSQAVKLEKVFKHIKQGDALSSDKNFVGALAKYNDALQIDPDNQIVLDKIIKTQEKKQIYQDAKLRAAKILKQGNVHFDAGDYNKAIAVYRRALKVLPEDSETKELIRASRI